MIDTIIFDCEGVVLDTEDVWDMGQEEFLRRRGFVYDRESIKPLLTGRSLVEGVKVLQSKYGFSGDLHEQARERAEIVRDLFETEVEFIDGFHDFFNSIRNDFKTCIATAMDPTLLALLDRRIGLAQLFDNRIYTLDDVGRSKPYPDLFLHAAEQLQSTPAQCLVFEDAPHGIEAAHRAGMKCFALTTTYTSDELEKSEEVLPGFSHIEIRALKYGEYRLVHRYKVKNRFDDTIISITKAPLNCGSTTFTDDNSYWEDETVMKASPTELINKLAFPEGGGPIDADLQPGRTFLRGRFRETWSKGLLTGFEVNEGAEIRWKLIDQPL